MNLSEELIAKLLEKQPMRVTFPQLEKDLGSLLESRCYLALVQIRNILQNKDLQDNECFLQIEEVICVLEHLGSDGGPRHDF